MFLQVSVVNGVVILEKPSTKPDLPVPILEKNQTHMMLCLSAGRLLPEKDYGPPPPAGQDLGNQSQFPFEAGTQAAPRPAAGATQAASKATEPGMLWFILGSSYFHKPAGIVYQV